MGPEGPRWGVRVRRWGRGHKEGIYGVREGYKDRKWGQKDHDGGFGLRDGDVRTQGGGLWGQIGM